MKPFSSPKWRNITISGQAASGTTTLALALAKKLHWRVFCGGRIVRDYMKKKSLPLEHTLASSDKFHLAFDNLIKEKLQKEKNLIIESWLAGFDAQGIPKVCKILLLCSRPEITLKRLMEREKMTEKEAKIHLATRQRENLEKWEKLYHTRDFWQPKFYDLVLDTAFLNRRQTLEKVLQFLGYFSPSFNDFPENPHPTVEK